MCKEGGAVVNPQLTDSAQSISRIYLRLNICSVEKQLAPIQVQMFTAPQAQNPLGGDGIGDANAVAALPQGPQQVTQIQYKAMSTTDMQSLLNSMPQLKRDSPNSDFWQKLEKWGLVSQLHAYDIYTVYKAKCPQTVWAGLNDVWKNGTWAVQPYPTLEAMKGEVVRFTTALKEALGTGYNLYGLYADRRKKRGESFQEYAEEKFKLYREHGGVPNPAEDDRAFLDMLLTGVTSQSLIRSLHATQALLTTYSQFLSWASNVEKEDESREHKKHQTHQRTKALTPTAPMLPIQSDRKPNVVRQSKPNIACGNCGRRGHTRTYCKSRGSETMGKGRCFRCGSENHWWKECPSNKEENPNPKSIPKGKLTEMSKDELIRLLENFNA